MPLLRRGRGESGAFWNRIDGEDFGCRRTVLDAVLDPGFEAETIACLYMLGALPIDDEVSRSGQHVGDFDAGMGLPRGRQVRQVLVAGHDNRVSAAPSI